MPLRGSGPTFPRMTQDRQRFETEFPATEEKEVEHWSLTTLREKVVKIGAKVVSHGSYVTFQLAEVAVPRKLFWEILRRIEELRPPPPIPA